MTQWKGGGAGFNNGKTVANNKNKFPTVSGLNVPIFPSPPFLLLFKCNDPGGQTKSAN